MAAPSDKQLARSVGWPAGIDNLNPEQSLARDDQGSAVIALRDAENVDLDRQGKPSLRAGYTKIVSASGAHSLWSDPGFPFGLYVDAGRLMGLREDGESFQLASGLGLQPVSYALAAGRVYWSSAAQNGRVTADGAVEPWGITSPQGAPSAVAASTGGLYGGRYQVTATFLSTTGEESGAPESTVMEVPPNGGIQLAAIPQPPNPSWRVRLYVSQADGDVLNSVLTLPSGITTAIVTVFRPGKTLETQFLDAMPPGHIVRWLNGRLYVAVGNVMVYSEALRYGLTRLSENRIGFETTLAMMEPLGAGDDMAGMFVASGAKTYWLPGTDPKEFHVKIARAHGVVPGTPIRVPGDVFGLQSTAPVIYWLDDAGTGCLGLPGGDVQPLRQNQTIAPEADAGASLYRDQDGVRQVITALTGARERGVAIGDKVECTVIRHDP